MQSTPDDDPVAKFWLAKIDEKKPPEYLGDTDDIQYKKDWIAGYLRHLEKRNDLIWEFVQKCPKHFRAPKLMDEWFQNLAGGTVPCTFVRIDEALISIDTILVKQPADWVVDMGKYYKAYYKLCLPWNQLIQLDKVNAPPDDSQRRNVIQIGMRVIEEYEEESKNDPRVTRLYDTLAIAGKDPVSARAIYARICNDYPDHPNSRLYKGKLNQFDKVGEPFTLSFDDAATGEPVDIADYKGKVVLVVFWSNDLESSQKHMPEVKRLWFRYQHEGLEVVDVSLDRVDSTGGKTSYLDYLSRHKMDWKHYFQGNGLDSDYSLSWGVNTLPTWFLVDRKGVLRHSDAHLSPETRIKALLAEKQD